MQNAFRALRRLHEFQAKLTADKTGLEWATRQNRCVGVVHWVIPRLPSHLHLPVE